ncbi:MAG TPA: dihydroneopterin triphosphate diphosphatase [Chromatiaceae bacterium]|nr:dihydroneopterin triphosphate diphosphatase [Chromatiaceae bacterium]
MPNPYKRPESVLLVIATLGGEFLMLERAQPAGFWQSVTGSLEPGESPRQAAGRELREETGIKVPDATLIDLRHRERFPIVPAWRARYAPEVHENLEHWFALVLPFRRLINLDAQEHRQYDWPRARAATFLASSWTNRQAIRLLDSRLS